MLMGFMLFISAAFPCNFQIFGNKIMLCPNFQYPFSDFCSGEYKYIIFVYIIYYIICNIHIQYIIYINIYIYQTAVRLFMLVSYLVVSM